MKIRPQNGLLLVNILAILLIIIISFFPANTLRIVLGLPFLLFFPGYTLIAALFPRRNTLASMERMLLSFGFSVVAVPFIGLILNYTPWGIRLYPILASLTIFIVVTSIVAWYRQRWLAQEERFSIFSNLSLPGWKGQNSLDRILSVVLIVAITGAIGALGYAITAPKVGERFTEFYILGPDGRAIDYPRELTVGEEGSVLVGIINREHGTVTYRVEVRIGGITNNRLEPLVLAPDEKWEGIVSFTLHQAGENQKVAFLLYRDEESEPYPKQPHLWINVTE